MTLEPGTLLNNRYRIEEIIARGGMGAIYCGIDESLNVKVAIKENLALSADAARQFRKEATILANLRHPNLPRVTDHFTLPDQGQYLVMDYIEGDDLRQRITHLGKLPEDEVILIGIAICDALEYLHTRTPSVLHRDIKPGNIKITPAGQVCLVDFGLAKLTQTGVATTTGAQGLTPGFAPPEQYGQGTEPRSDIYALGASLYTALTGAIPEDGLSRAMHNGELTSILIHNPALSPRLAAVIEKAMSIAQDDRHPSAASFKHALLESSTAVRRKHQQMSEIQITSTVVGVATSTPTSAPFPAAPAFGQKRAGTKKALLITIPVLLLGLCAGGAFIFRQSISQTISALAPAVSAPSPTELVAGSFNNPTETKVPGSSLPTPTLEVTPTLASTL
ncbi:MAG: serine/threonine-protein kinase, partial [Anaerolineaceae bacterium]|nr:serine/threonine-protein kinase [Anaerolineaceae bacterium]